MIAGRHQELLLIVTVVVCIVGAGYGLVHLRQIQNTIALSTASDESFPNVIEAELSPLQLRIVDLLRKEYAAQPEGLKYSEGSTEPWCANFVSWIRKESGAPLNNPVTGGWRIPGTLTLRDAFVASGKWHPYGDGYTPKTGDVAIYDGFGPHGQHANFVVRYIDGTLITIGGNEVGSIRRQDYTLDGTLGVLGCGQF